MLIAGARPNFVKIAPIMDALMKRPAAFEPILVHTGQHYDTKMSAVFFAELGVPQPDLNLGIGSGSHAEQTGRTMMAIEQACLEREPDLVIVVGDVNATLAAALAAKKLGIKVAHVEAGLRAHDRTMPEEINRIATDRISDLLFTTDHYADENLLNEGIPVSMIHRVGNVMIDTLLGHRARAARSDILDRLEIKPRQYALATLHRGANVDRPKDLSRLLQALNVVSKEIPIVLPLHPRTRQRLDATGLHDLVGGSRIRLIEPLGYLDFVRLMDQARLVMTDSGGVQEETTVLGVPCLTLRRTTERPITCQIGTNLLVGVEPQYLLKTVNRLLAHPTSGCRVPPLWDGRAAERLVTVLEGPVDMPSLSLATPRRNASRRRALH